MDLNQLVPRVTPDLNKQLHLVHSEASVDREITEITADTPSIPTAEAQPETDKQPPGPPAAPVSHETERQPFSSPDTPARPDSEKHSSTTHIPPALPQIEKSLSAQSIICRICHQGSVHGNSFVNPCNCKGTAGFVHPNCLHRWISTSGRSQCEICLFQFPVVKTRRLGLCESIRRWLLLPGRMKDFIGDSLMAILLTSATGALVTICLLGKDYFVREGIKVGVGKIWTRGAVGFFVGILIFGYAVTMALMARDIVYPWWVWWRSGVDVVQVLSEEVTVPRERSLGMAF